MKRTFKALAIALAAICTTNIGAWSQGYYPSTGGSGGGGSPGGLSGSIQYNNSGAFGGIDAGTDNTKVLGSDGAHNWVLTTPTGSGTVNSGTSGQLGYYASSSAAVSGNSNATISGGTLTLGSNGATQGGIVLYGATSGSVAINPTAVAGTGTTLTIPASNSVTIIPSTAGSHQFATAVSAGGVITWSQPAAADVSGLAASATTDTTNASNISSGTLQPGRLPNPSLTTLGGIQSAGAASHQWISAISNSGVPALTQPAFTDISGTATAAQGGTGVATLAAHGVVIGNGTGAVNVTSAGTTGYVLTSNGASADPTFQAAAGGSLPTGFTGDPQRRSSSFNPRLGSTSIDTVAGAGASTNLIGTAVVLNGATMAPYVTAASTGSQAFIRSGGTDIQYALKPTVFGVFSLGTTTNIRYWFGTWNNNSSLSFDLPGASAGYHGAGIRASTGGSGAGDTNFKYVTSNGSSDTVVDSGVAIDGNNHTGYIDETSPTQITFSIDGGHSQTVTTTLPGSTQNLVTQCGVTSLTGSASTLNIGRIYRENF